jgi:hypothetical protein
MIMFYGCNEIAKSMYCEAINGETFFAVFLMKPLKVCLGQCKIICCRIIQYADFSLGTTKRLKFEIRTRIYVVFFNG